MVNYEKLMEERIDALWAWDYDKYRRLSWELGIEPEFPELFERRMADLIYSEMQKTKN